MGADASAWPRIRRFIDPHHHLWDRGGETYLVDQFSAEFDSFMAPQATVYVECLNHYHDEGDEALRCTGEAEFVAALIARLSPARQGNLLGGFVGYGDLALGDGLGRVLDSYAEIIGERFKGVRYPVAWVADSGIHSAYRTRAGMLLEDANRQAVEALERRALSLDVWAYFTQLGELAEFLGATRNLDVVLDHCGGPIGVGSFAGRRDEVFTDWRGSMQRLAACDRLTIKFGGLAMAVAGFGWHRRDTRPSADDLAAAWRPYFDVCLELFGPQRMMFESNFPVDRKGADYGPLWNAFALLAEKLTEQERDQLFFATAARVYRL